MGTKNGSGYNTFAMVVRNKVPSLLLPALRPELKQEKQLLERLSHRHWKAISMRVGIGLGDTYGPMHYPGMRSLWQSPANFHQHLAFPPPLLHQALLPGSFFSSSLSKPCSLVIVPGWWPLIERKRKILYCPAGMAQSWRCAIIAALFPIMMELIVDTSRRESVFDSALLVSFITEPWKYPKTTD